MGMMMSQVDKGSWQQLHEEQHAQMERMFDAPSGIDASVYVVCGLLRACALLLQFLSSSCCQLLAGAAAMPCCRLAKLGTTETNCHVLTFMIALMFFVLRALLQIPQNAGHSP
jgi:hypothetical protein